MRVIKSSLLIIMCLLLLSSCDLYNPDDKRSQVGKTNNEKTHQEILVDEINADSNKEAIADENIPQDKLEVNPINGEVSETVSSIEPSTDQSDPLTGDLDINKDNRETAKELNTEGFELYRESKYEEALVLFEESFMLDDDYFYSHFNYACTLGVLMKGDNATWDKYKDDAIDHLLKAIEADSSLKDKILTDKDLDPLRGEARFVEEILGN